MTWLWILPVAWLAVIAWVLCLCIMAKDDDLVLESPVPERTAAMCEYGACRERWTVLVHLGLKGSRYVCDQHVEAVVRESVEPEPMGVRS